MNKNEKAIVLALRLGYTRTIDLIDQTGLSTKTIEFNLSLLRLEHDAASNEHLAAILAPKPPEQQLRFASHDCVMIDASLSPVIAATLLQQVLGEAYCNDLKIAL